MNLSTFKRDIDELIGEFVEDDLTTFADLKSVWLSRKFSYIYEASPNSNLAFFMQSLYAHTIGHMVSIDSFSRRLGGLYCLYCLYEIQPFKPKFRVYISLQELGKLRDLVVEAKDKCVEIAAAVAKEMLDKNRLLSETEIEQFVHLDMGKELDLSSLHKTSLVYAVAKKRSIKGEIVEIEDIKHISEEKELMGRRVERLKEEWDSQRISLYEQTKLDCLTTTAQKQLKDVEHDEDDGFAELDRLLSPN
ncbi:uncharacterized protein LOC17899429 isoform X2 [Capsella rubella]|uniref:uncharacterized protein LOC17899429 isoform X2 n=1 Tax=Capsella rubella TaxID=81985 RepID=UPI000CD5559E|nr:uncharacterized protein LOC17899429 isoform X2 [Capsella rubella]